MNISSCADFFAQTARWRVDALFLLTDSRKNLGVMATPGAGMECCTYTSELNAADVDRRHYRAGRQALHLRVKSQWARVIDGEMQRQIRSGAITRDALMRRLGDRSSGQFRRDVAAISKSGTRNEQAERLPGLSRLLLFAAALGIEPAQLEPPSARSKRVRT